MIAQTRILEFYQTTFGRRYLAAFFADMNEKHNPQARRNVELMAAIQYGMIQNGEPVWVSGDMTDLIDHARWSFEPEMIMSSDPWCECAFVLFPKPLELYDMPPTESNPLRSPDGLIPVRALAWATHASEDRSMGSFWVAVYTHIDDESETDWRYKPGERDELRRIAPLSMAHQFQLSWHGDPRDWDDPSRYDVLPEDSIEDMLARGRQQLQLIQTTWRIAQQFIPVRQTPPRQMWRHAQRKGLKHKDVTVITLRRTKPVRDGEPVESGRRLTVRHWVRGYWARRHFREGPRQVWVRGHIKGRDDLPFQATSRAWEFKR